MIYRIAIFKDGKFNHYATPEEMETLRVNADGEAEALSAKLNDYNIILGFCWMPVSDTHKVEWGVYDPLADPQKCRMYENDIIRDCGGVVNAQYDIKNIIYWMAEATIATEDVLGNINENPELMGGEL